MSSNLFLKLRGTALQRLMLFLIVIPTFLAMGYVQPFFDGISSYPNFYTAFPTINTTTSKGAAKSQHSITEGIVNSCLNLGAVTGALSCMYTGNKLGRRKTVAIGSIIIIVGTIIFASSTSVAQIVIGRFITGFGLGMSSTTVPVWQAETSTTTNRGHHVIVDGMCIALGIAISAWITFGFSKVHTSHDWQWRVSALGPGVLALVVLSFTFTFPESPRWLALEGHYDQAKEILATVSGQDITSESVATELAAVIRANDQAAEGASFFSLFKIGKEKMLYRVILASSAHWYGQMGGSALITYYSAQLFKNIGLTADLSKLLGAAVLTFKFVCCFIPFFTIEKAGRRKLFLIAGSGMATCMYCLAICGSQVSSGNLAPAYAGIVFVFAFVAFYPIGFLGLNFVFSQEIITTRYRAPASGVATAVHWLTSFTVSLTTPLGFTAIGWKFYLIWAASASCIIPLVYFLYPETTGFSMEEIDNIYIDATSLLGTVSLARQRRKEKMRNLTNGNLEGAVEIAVAKSSLEHFETQ